MKKLSILVPEGAILGSIEGPRLVFSEVNQMLVRMEREPLFEVKLVALHPAISLNKGMYSINPDMLISEVKETDLIIIPALEGDMIENLRLSEDFIPWILHHYKQGAEVASLCVGAFLLASTGLVNGKKCSTHWMAANDFRRMFPDVNLVEDQIITDEQGIYSSGGAFSYLNLVLYLIEKYAGRDVAILCSKAFQIEFERRSQSPFIIFQGQKDHEDEEIRKAQEFIEENYTERITVDQLSAMLAIGRRSLERRFRKATSNSISEYIQRVKIEAAKKGLETTRKNVSEVMYEVGYTDTKAFRGVFKKITGLSPADYKNKYSRILSN